MYGVSLKKLVLGNYSPNYGQFLIIILYFWSTGKEIKSLAHSQEKVLGSKRFAIHAYK